jgi:hypothetical protein
VTLSVLFGERAPRFETKEVGDFFEMMHLWENVLTPGTKWFPSSRTVFEHLNPSHQALTRPWTYGHSSSICQVRSLPGRRFAKPHGAYNVNSTFDFWIRQKNVWLRGLKTGALWSRLALYMLPLKFQSMTNNSNDL